MTPQEIEQVAQRAAALIRKDLAVLLHGTRDGTHPNNLDRLCGVADAIKKKVGA